MPTNFESPEWFRRFWDKLAVSDPGFRPYKYKPLPHGEYVRVLELLPGSGKDQLRCRLHISRLDKAEDTYEAISYVWGDPKKTHRIQCESGFINVTVNLGSALLALRYPHKPKRLWADALCINQRTIEEKNHQIWLMARIFQCAKRVVVWLGRDTDGTAKDCFGIIRDTNAYLGSLFTMHNHFYFPDLDLPVGRSDPSWDLFSALIFNPWFSRGWVVQEAAVAKTCFLRWGDDELGIAEFFELVEWFNIRRDFWPAGFDTPTRSRLASLRDVFAMCFCTYGIDNQTWRTTLPRISSLQRSVTYLEEPLSFVHILQATSKLEVSLSIDRIYAFLGNPLARRVNGVNGNQTMIIEPDYTKSVSDIWLELAKNLVCDSREGSSLLTYPRSFGFDAGLNGKIVTPSWIPRDHLGLQWCPPAPVGSNFRAGGSAERYHVRCFKNLSLALHGLLFDEFYWVSDSTFQFYNFSLDPSWWEESLWDRDMPYIDHWWQEVLQNSPPLTHDAQKGWSTKFLMTLTMGFFGRDNEVAVAGPCYDAYRKLATRAYATRQAQPTSRTSKEEASNALRYFSQLRFSVEMRLAVTNGCRLALVPPFVQRGDSCCIILGVKAPLVLRRRKSSASEYFRVGDAYIHGVMDGELVKEIDTGERRVEEIIIV